jgi:hypothetical protein
VHTGHDRILELLSVDVVVAGRISGVCAESIQAAHVAD